MNEKLIPNGTQLWKLINTISSPDLLHWKYATYGTLNAVVSASNASQHYSFLSEKVTIYTEDFKGFSVVFNTVTNKGETFSKELPLYESSEVPNFSVTYAWYNNTSIKITSSIEEGIVSMEFGQESVPIFSMGLTQRPTENQIETYTSIVIKQYGKIVPIQKFHYSSLSKATVLEGEEEKSSEAVQEDNTEIK